MGNTLVRQTSGSHNYEKALRSEIAHKLKLGIIQPSDRPWCSRMVPITKKDGRILMCIDYRALNEITVKDSYLIARIDSILDGVAKARMFSTLDGTSGY